MPIPAGAVSVMDRPYNARGLGRAWDDTDAFRRALEDHEHVYCPTPPVAYAIRSVGEVVHGLKISVPIKAGRSLTGDGARILTLLDDRHDPRDSLEHSSPNSISHFFLEEEADDVTIRGLEFHGEAPNVTPENHELNLQMCPIEAMWGPRAPKRLTIEHCGFFNQWGFVTHQRFGGAGYRFRSNVVRDCMNGVNWNSPGQVCEANDIAHSEAFECSGSGSEYIGNVLTDVYGGFSIGGDMGEGTSATVSRGSRIAHNAIQRVLAGRAQVPQAIIIADNMVDWVVEDNAIYRAIGVGIMVQSQDSRGRPIMNGTIRRNRLVSGRGHPIYLVGCRDVDVEENEISDRDEAGRLLYEGEETPSAIMLEASVPGSDIRIGRQRAIRIHPQRRAIVVPENWRNVEVAA